MSIGSPLNCILKRAMHLVAITSSCSINPLSGQHFMGDSPEIAAQHVVKINRNGADINCVTRCDDVYLLLNEWLAACRRQVDRVFFLTFDRWSRERLIYF